MNIILSISFICVLCGMFVVTLPVDNYQKMDHTKDYDHIMADVWNSVFKRFYGLPSFDDYGDYYFFEM